MVAKLPINLNKIDRNKQTQSLTNEQLILIYGCFCRTNCLRHVPLSLGPPTITSDRLEQRYGPPLQR